MYLDKGDSLAQSERHSIIQSVEEDRRYWVHACIARILKEKKQVTYHDLIGLIQKEAGNRFQACLLKSLDWSICIEYLLFNNIFVKQPKANNSTNKKFDRSFDRKIFYRA